MVVISYCNNRGSSAEAGGECSINEDGCVGPAELMMRSSMCRRAWLTFGRRCDWQTTLSARDDFGLKTRRRGAFHCLSRFERAHSLSLYCPFTTQPGSLR